MTLPIDERAARHELERRKREWLYEDRYEPEPEPSFTERERSDLWRTHRPYDAGKVDWSFWPDGSRGAQSAYVCSTCYEEWKNGGCSTIRALAILARRNAQVLQLNKRNRNMAEFLAEWFARRTVGPGLINRGVAECTLRVDVRMLAEGRMMVVDELLAKMRDQWKHYLLQLFPPSAMEVAAKAFNESFANIERDKRRAQADGDGE